MAKANNEEAEEEAEEVEVRRSEMALPAAEGKTETTIYVTYTVKDLPPGLITIPKAKWTAEHEAELIREDVTKRRLTKPTTIRI